ncbi:kinase-like domain-containing protein [Trametes maxima]|nr:kinase-like domain-containing protein [Trametes maxima]KAI0666031.1 kinase-like domain-containing protein [Trametes maxima]
MLEEPGALSDDEIWWRDHQVWLQARGYMLRPRYSPDWIPTWKDTSGDHQLAEDGQRIVRGNVLDATRALDGAVVVLKMVMLSRHPHEIKIAQFFSSGTRASDPRNHCVPVLEVLDVPGERETKVVVMPLLRSFHDPPFTTVGEAMECCRQLVEGLQFMHIHHVAHRDIGKLNIMMDPQPMFPELFHFAAPWMNRDMTKWVKYRTRTSCPTKYFLIDFGLSRKYDPSKEEPRAWPILGGDKSVPEFHRSSEPYDPFPTDVYCLGNLIRTVFLEEYKGLDFMAPLVRTMVRVEPATRPTMDEVSKRFDMLLKSLSPWKLRSRLAPRYELWILKYCRVAAHASRTLYQLMTFRPALPHP